MNSRFRFITSSAVISRQLLLALGALLVLAVPAFADVCVWRDPERTMQKLFPAARDYRTTTVKFDSGKVRSIEQALGGPFEEASAGEFNFYDIMGVVQGKPQKLGTLMALAGKGEYGVIEVVIGLDTSGKIIGAYIQRSRERVTRALQSPAFLSQFNGKTIRDDFQLGTSLKPAAADAETASRTVAQVIHKMMVFYDVLAKGGRA